MRMKQKVTILKLMMKNSSEKIQDVNCFKGGSNGEVNEKKHINIDID